MRFNKNEEADLKKAYDATIAFLSDAKKVHEAIVDPKNFLVEKLSPSPFSTTERKGCRLFKLPKVANLESEIYIGYNLVRKKLVPKYFYLRISSAKFFDHGYLVYMGGFSAACGKLVYEPDSFKIFKNAMNALLRKSAEKSANFRNISDESKNLIQASITKKFIDKDTTPGPLCTISEGGRDYSLVLKKISYSNQDQYESIEASFTLLRPDNTLVCRLGIMKLFTIDYPEKKVDTWRLGRSIRSKILKDLVHNKLVMHSSVPAKYSL